MSFQIRRTGDIISGAGGFSLAFFTGRGYNGLYQAE